MKRLSIVPSWARQAKRDKPQRFKQLPTSWWSVLHAYLKKLRRAAQKSSTSCQTTVNHSPHPSAPIKTLHQKVYPKQQLWQLLKGPSTDSHSTLGSNITSSCSQPSVNFSLRLSPAIPAGSHSLAHRGLSALLINHPSLKVSGISQLTDMNSLLKYASLKPLPLIIHTSTPTLSILPLPESQHNQKKAALVYLPKQINYLPPLPPRMEVDRPPQPLDADGQWLANKPQVIDPAGETTNAFPEGSTAKETEPERPAQKKSKSTVFKPRYLPKLSMQFSESKKRRNPYFGSESELVEPPKKRARLESNSTPGEAETLLIDPAVEMINPSPEESTVKETELKKSTQKKSQSITCKTQYLLKPLKIIQESRKRWRPYFDSELTEPPKKHARLESNSPLGETGTSLIESENTVTETKSEKAPREKSQNTKCEIDYFFNISKKFKASTKFQKSRKNSNSYSGSELSEPPKKRAKLVSCYEPKEPTIIEAKSDKQTQGSFQNIILKRAVVFDTSKNECQESRKCYNLFGSELAESPTKRDKLASNPDKTIASLLESENKVICSSVEITNPSLKESTVKETESEKSTQKKSQGNRFKEAVFFKTSKNKNQESRKRCHLDSDSELIEPPKKPTTLVSISDPDEIGTSLIESKNKDKQSIKYDDYGVETTTEKTDSSSEKWSGSELSNSEPSETETAIESDWCYPLAAYGYDTQRYPLLTQLPDDCHWGKRILRDFKPEYTFWLDNEEKSMLWGVRHYPVLAEFFQIDPLTYQHPYLEQAINAYTAPTESPSCSANPVAVASHWQPQNISTSPTHCLLASS